MKLKIKVKQNIGMSVFIEVVDTAQIWNRIKLFSRKIEIENEVTEYEIKNEIKVQTKYWHECWHGCRQHSTKIKRSYWVVDRTLSGLRLICTDFIKGHSKLTESDLR